MKLKKFFSGVISVVTVVSTIECIEKLFFGRTNWLIQFIIGLVLALLGIIFDMMYPRITTKRKESNKIVPIRKNTLEANYIILLCIFAISIGMIMTFIYAVVIEAKDWYVYTTTSVLCFIGTPIIFSTIESLLKNE